MLYTLEQSQPQSDKHICNEHVIVKVKILNLHILKNTDILNCNCYVEYSLKNEKFKSNVNINVS